MYSETIRMVSLASNSLPGFRCRRRFAPHLSAMYRAPNSQRMMVVNHDKVDLLLHTSRSM